MQDLQGRLESYIKMQYNQNEILDLYKRQAQVGGKLDLQVIFQWFGRLLSVIPIPGAKTSTDQHIILCFHQFCQRVSLF